MQKIFEKPTTKEFAARRSAVAALNGMVATSQPLAAVAGLRMLLAGGNAIDAAIATAATLNVVEPMSTGIGGDAFALVWIAREKKLYALNASGRAPLALTIEECRKQGATREIPLNGWLPVTVPGALDGWATLLDRFGTMKLADVLAPAIEYAEKGFPVSELIAQSWERAQPKLDMNPAAARAYLTRDRAPRAGEIHCQPDLARTFRAIVEGGRDAFYRGDIAEKIVAHAQQTGGFFSRQDFANHTSTWEEPISIDYRGATIYECPPNGQGIAALEALDIVEGFDLASWGHNSAEYLHRLIEAMKLAFADAGQYVCDPQHVDAPIEELLDKRYTASRRAEIDLERANPDAQPGIPTSHDTVYLSVVDREHNAVSFINSLYMGFGAGIVVPGTGICLQNRGANFSLDAAHPNALTPGKRPYHTIIPAMALREDELWMSFGVMGGFMQPQGHLQVVCNMIDFGMDPQRALDAPRFQWIAAAQVALEQQIDSNVRGGLSNKGHELVPAPAYTFGGGQIIAVNQENGALVGGSDPRKDGCAIGW